MRSPFHERRLPVSLLALALTLLTGPAAARIAEVTVEVDGMACPFCGYGIEKRLRKVEGVAGVTVHLREGRAEVAAAEDASLDLAAIRRAVEKAGFTPGRLWLEASGRVVAGEDGETWRLQLDGDAGSLPVAADVAEVRDRLRALAESGTRSTWRGEVTWRDGTPWLVPELEAAAG